MNKILIITESRTVAKTIAQALGANILHKGYFGKGNIAVTWTGGNIITATPKCKFQFSVCSDMSADETFAANFDFRIRRDGKCKGSKGKYLPSEKDAAQVAVIEKLWRDADMVYNAMKPSSAGEVTFTSLALYIKANRPVLRMWLRTVTRQAILDAIEYTADANPAYSAFHDNAIAEYTIGARPINGDGYQTEVSAADMEWSMDNLKRQAHENKNWAPAKTTGVAYSLYNKGLISYPAEDVTELPASAISAMMGSLSHLRHHPELGARVAEIRTANQVDNIPAADCGIAHFGVTVTGLYPSDLTSEERYLYGIVAAHSLDVLSASCKA